MTKSKFPEWLITLLVLLVAFTIALFIRVALPYSNVFSGQWIKLTDIDAYFYMRLVDNLVHNFPQLVGFDPYNVFPGGSSIGNVPVFFAYLMAGIIKLIGGASPSQQTVDTIAVYIPAVLGALTVIPVYFIARALINRWAGMIAVLLIAVMPGEFLARSLLGNTDHHVAETFFTTFFIMFFILAIKHGRQFTYSMLRKGQFTPASRHIPYSFIAGIFLGLYLITWQGALLFIFIIFVFFITQFISDHLHGFPTDYLSKIAITCFLIALLIFVPVSRDKITLLALAAIILVPIVLNVISVLMTARGIKPVYYLAAIGGLSLLGIILTWLIFPAIFHTVTGYAVSIFSWRMEQNVVGEMKPLFFPGSYFTLEMVWNQYALAIYSGLLGLIILIYNAVRRGEPDKIFTAVWSIIIIFASFAMVRFAAYSAVCFAVLTGYLGGWTIEVFSSRREPDMQRLPHKKAKRAAAQTKKMSTAQITAIVIVVVVSIAVFIPGLANTFAEAKNASHVPSDAWMEAMDWLRQNTAEPFSSADYYYALYNTPTSGRGYDFPPTAYGVTVWSDYGYWVTRTGHRIPVANPGTGTQGEAVYFTSQGDANTTKIMKNWGSRYVIVDSRIASPNDKFYALANLSNMKEPDFYELCWQKKGDKYTPLLVFYPEFYRAMVSRLYYFDGKQVVPQAAIVMSWQERQLPDGQKFKEILGLKNFRSYDEAQAFISAQKQGAYSIIGTDPLVSPVSLEALNSYKLAYTSSQKASAGSTQIPVIKIFEYKQPNVPVTGDWNKDSKDKVGIWIPESGYFLLDTNGDGKWNPDKGDTKLGPMGKSTDIPLTGNWDGTGKTKLGFFRPSDQCFYLDMNDDGAWNPDKGDLKLGPFGNPMDTPVSGDWNASGKYKIGIYYRGNQHFYLDTNGNGRWDWGDSGDINIGPFGNVDDIAITGDWNGDKKTEVGVRQPQSCTFLLDMDGDGKWNPERGDLRLGPFGTKDDLPLSGDWTGGGKSRIGTYNPHDRCFYLDINGDGKWNPEQGI